MHVRLRVICDAPFPALVVPDEFVQLYQTGGFALVLNQQNFLKRRLIQFGIRGRGWYEVRSGLRATDRIAVWGEASGFVNSPVIPKETKAAFEP